MEKKVKPHQKKEGVAKRGKGKKPYKAPELVKLGTADELTQGGPGTPGTDYGTLSE